jgi:release factor glutamine methyltransferase
MPVSPSSSSLSSSAIVTMLRAAGCVFAEDEARLLISTASTPADLAAMVDRRIAGLPLEQVLGWAEFCGLRIAVEPGVFVPRRRTEFLLQQAVTLARRSAVSTGQPLTPQVAGSAYEALAPQVAGSAREALIPQTAGSALEVLTPQVADSALEALVPRSVGFAREAPVSQSAGSGGRALAVSADVVVVDLCCGSGALGAALVAALGAAELHAVDIDPAAVRCARRNLTGSGAHVYEGDLYEPLPASLRGRVGILVASPPYVPTEAIRLLPAEAREHEPRVALDGGADGLDIVRRVAAAASEWLAPGGYLLVETSERQAPQTVEAAARTGLIPQVAGCEELNATVVIAVKPAVLAAGAR